MYHHIYQRHIRDVVVGVPWLLGKADAPREHEASAEGDPLESAVVVWMEGFREGFRNLRALQGSLNGFPLCGLKS
jgi:hypothetical protein